VLAPVTMLRVYCSVAGRVGDDEFAQRRRENRYATSMDALLSLCAEAVGQQRQVGAALRGAAKCERAASWSARMAWCREQAPISVLLPSSTLPGRDKAQHAVLEHLIFPAPTSGNNFLLAQFHR
jgi:hypothetical protein